MTWFVVTVEHETGIRGEHCVQAVYPSSAVEHEQSAGFKVLSIRERSTRQFPEITRLQF